ncbi:transposase [Alkalicoccus luteus]|uniref:Transposase n=2 Tax=Alkalicoccus luteus TaxID=1237094 RepID=A0A969TWN9_9BACI|nr:transposase [Alkalicoccus luteus]NJP39427.1 transposase [Alkalicoccus luteus]
MSYHVSPEYKEYIAKLVEEEGHSQRDLAEEIGKHRATVGKWVKAYRLKVARERSGDILSTPGEMEAVKRAYEKKMRDLEEENEILKKAMHIFTQPKP